MSGIIKEYGFRGESEVVNWSIFIGKTTNTRLLLQSLDLSFMIWDEVSVG